MSKKREATFHMITPKEEIRLEDATAKLCHGGNVCPSAATCTENLRCTPQVPRPEKAFYGEKQNPPFIKFNAYEDPVIDMARAKAVLGKFFEDPVAHPSHYSKGLPEGMQAIDVIRAHMAAGGTWETANALKYILRMFHKGNPQQDAAKAAEYLRLWLETQA